MTDTGSIRVVLGHWPIVLHISEGSPTEAQIDDYVREATAVLKRCEPHVVVMDTTRLVGISSYGRMIKKDWLLEHRDLLRKYCLGTALALSSPVVRWVSSTIMLVRPLPTPYVVCETVEEAMAWARAQLDRAGMAIR